MAEQAKHVDKEAVDTIEIKPKTGADDETPKAKVEPKKPKFKKGQKLSILTESGPTTVTIAEVVKDSLGDRYMLEGAIGVESAEDLVSMRAQADKFHEASDLVDDQIETIVTTLGKKGIGTFRKYVERSKKKILVETAKRAEDLPHALFLTLEARAKALEQKGIIEIVKTVAKQVEQVTGVDNAQRAEIAATEEHRAGQIAEDTLDQVKDEEDLDDLEKTLLTSVVARDVRGYLETDDTLITEAAGDPEQISNLIDSQNELTLRQEITDLDQALSYLTMAASGQEVDQAYQTEIDELTEKLTTRKGELNKLIEEHSLILKKEIDEIDQSISYLEMAFSDDRDDEQFREAVAEQKTLLTDKKQELTNLLSRREDLTEAEVEASLDTPVDVAEYLEAVADVADGEDAEPTHEASAQELYEHMKGVLSLTFDNANEAITMIQGLQKNHADWPEAMQALNRIIKELKNSEIPNRRQIAYMVMPLREIVPILGEATEREAAVPKSKDELITESIGKEFTDDATEGSEVELVGIFAPEFGTSIVELSTTEEAKNKLAAAYREAYAAIQESKGTKNFLGRLLSREKRQTLRDAEIALDIIEDKIHLLGTLEDSDEIAAAIDKIAAGRVLDISQTEVIPDLPAENIYNLSDSEVTQLSKEYLDLVNTYQKLPAKEPNSEVRFQQLLEKYAADPNDSHQEASQQLLADLERGATDLDKAYEFNMAQQFLSLDEDYKKGYLASLKAIAADKNDARSNAAQTTLDSIHELAPDEIQTPEDRTNFFTQQFSEHLGELHDQGDTKGLYSYIEKLADYTLDPEDLRSDAAKATIKYVYISDDVKLSKKARLALDVAKEMPAADIPSGAIKTLKVSAEKLQDLYDSDLTTLEAPTTEKEFDPRKSELYQLLENTLKNKGLTVDLVDQVSIIGKNAMSTKDTTICRTFLNDIQNKRFGDIASLQPTIEEALITINEAPILLEDRRVPPVHNESEIDTSSLDEKPITLTNSAKIISGESREPLDEDKPPSINDMLAEAPTIDTSTKTPPSFADLEKTAKPKEKVENTLAKGNRRKTEAWASSINKDDAWVKDSFVFGNEGDIVTKSDLDFSWVEAVQLPAFLKRVIVRGDLNLQESRITMIRNLPTEIQGSLNLSDTNTRVLSILSGVNIGKDLVMIGSAASILPKGINLGGQVIIGENQDKLIVSAEAAGYDVKIVRDEDATSTLIPPVEQPVPAAETTIETAKTIEDDVSTETLDDVTIETNRQETPEDKFYKQLLDAATKTPMTATYYKKLKQLMETSSYRMADVGKKIMTDVAKGVIQIETPVILELEKDDLFDAREHPLYNELTELYRETPFSEDNRRDLTEFTLEKDQLASLAAKAFLDDIESRDFVPAEEEEAGITDTGEFMARLDDIITEGRVASAPTVESGDEAELSDASLQRDMDTLLDELQDDLATVEEDEATKSVS